MFEELRQADSAFDEEVKTNPNLTELLQTVDQEEKVRERVYETSVSIAAANTAVAFARRRCSLTKSTGRAWRSAASA